MNIESFVFGILSGLGTIMVILVTIGVLKIFKMAKRLLTLESRVAEDERALHQDINMVEQTLLNQIRHTQDSVERHIEHVERHVSEVDRDLHSYTDARIDKLEQKLKHPGKKTIID